MEDVQFEQAVKSNKMYDEHWLYIIHYIATQFRERYIATLNKGFDMPTAFDLIIASVSISDEEYYKKLANTDGISNRN